VTRVTDYQTILLEISDGVATLTLNRPERYNAFDEVMLQELPHAWAQLRDDDEVRAVVLTAAGDAAFCTGIDRDAVPTTAEDYTFDPFTYQDPGGALGPKSHHMWKPVIGAVNGMACGGAFYLLGELEFLIAAETATFFDPHVTYGMAAVMEPTLLAPRMPFGELMRMMLLGAHERLSAARALEVGLVSEVVPGAELVDRARWAAEAIASQPVDAVMATVRTMWMAQELSRNQALGMGNFLLGAGNTVEGLAAGQAMFASGQRIRPNVR
jgi:enoyl-CoA hydratase/carnithine racemase